jgi:retinol dehydrogenase 12
MLVTGSTNGIGRATAEGLARMGATVIIVGRLEERCQTVMESIRLAGKGQVDYLIADLSDLEQVRRLALQFRQRYSRLDVLLNNAGAYYFKRQLNPDGYELTFATNYLSHFLLTMLLLDILTTTSEQYGEARIINVSSVVHASGKIDFSDLQSERSYGRHGFDAYCNSKLANIVFTFELARLLQGTSITVNALHPGLVATGFGTNNFKFIRLAMKIFGWFALNSEEGAQTSIYLAASPEVRGVSGQYFIKCKPARAAPQTYNEQIQQNLWDVSQKLVTRTDERRDYVP